MRTALLVFGIAFVTGQQFQDYKATSTSVVLASPGYFQRKSEDFQRNQFGDNFQERALTKTISDTPRNLQSANYRGDPLQQNSFASTLFRSSDVDRQHRFQNHFRSGRLFQSEGESLPSQYGRYQGDQRRRFQHRDSENLYQQNNQDFLHQRYQDNKLSVNSQQNRFAQKSRENGFHQSSQDNLFQQDAFQLNNQESILQQNNQENHFSLNSQAGQFQLNNKKVQPHHGSHDNLFQRHDQINQIPSTFVGENSSLRFSTSEENNRRNSFRRQDLRFRGSHFGQGHSQFLESDSDLTSLPAGARFSLESVDTSFQCAHRPYGFYADQSSGCRVFHVCNPDLTLEGRSPNFQSSFMCGEGFIFDQRRRTCVQERLALSCLEASNYYFTYKS